MGGFKIGAVLALIAGFGGAYATLDKFLVWKGEHLELAADVYTSEILRLRDMIWQLEERIRALVNRGQPVPRELGERLNELKTKEELIRAKMRRK